MIQQPLQDFITTGDRRIVALVLGGLLALVAVTVGLALAVVGPVYTAVGLAALAAGVWVIAGLENALWGVLAVITLLPFATLPVDIGITPTFLDMALGVAVGLYLLQWMTGERRRLTMTPVHGFIILFMLLCLFSFVAGMRHAGMSFTVARRLLELLLAMAFALILVDVLDTAEKIKRFVLVLLAGGTLAALIAIGLWILPDGTAASILGRLAIIGYPNAGIIQYIEQNPALSERAIGTAVNPNSLGGTLVLIAALAVPQLAAEQPLTGKRWHAVPVLGALGLALVLTFSRGSMLAFAAAVGFIAVLRYRKLLIVFAVLGVIFLLLPWTQGYIERFIAGFQGADLATQMRFGEYQDALTLIGRYPLLGVGFIGTPDIDIYLGVASVYLTIASNMGLLGMAGFLLVIGAVFAYGWTAHRHLTQMPGLYPIWLGLNAALVGTLVNGVFDHYFFNLEFMAAATLFWIYIGLLLSTSRLALAAEQDRLLREGGSGILRSTSGRGAAW